MIERANKRFVSAAGAKVTLNGKPVMAGRDLDPIRFAKAITRSKTARKETRRQRLARAEASLKQADY
jgi:hypothetical protein